MNQEFISKILDTLESKADLIGGAFGFFADPLNSAALADVPGIIITRLSKWKIPDPAFILSTMFDPVNADKYPIAKSIMAAAGGWVLSEVGGVVDPRLAKVGRAVKKMGVSAAISTAISGFVWLPYYQTSSTGMAGMATSAPSMAYSY